MAAKSSKPGVGRKPPNGRHVPSSVKGAKIRDASGAVGSNVTPLPGPVRQSPTGPGIGAVPRQATNMTATGAQFGISRWTPTPRQGPSTTN